MRHPRHEAVDSTAHVEPSPSPAPPDSLSRLREREGARSSKASGKGEGLAPSDPIRTCILTRIEGTRDDLIRLALAPEGAILPDIRAKAPGRGAWIGVTQAELETAVAKGKLKAALARAFKGAALSIPPELPAMIAEQLRRAALDRLGLEAKAGTLATGSDRIEDAARAGKLHLLLHASDAGADGMGKLAQAWRVGRDEEGSGLTGLVLPLDRPILSSALGRQNVVHIGLTDPTAARRVRAAIARWLRFIGTDPDPSLAQPRASAHRRPPFDAPAQARTDEDLSERD